MDLKLALGIPATIVSTVTAWVMLGFPTIATSADIRKLNMQQSTIASEVYAGKVRKSAHSQAAGGSGSQANLDRGNQQRSGAAEEG